MTERRQGGPHRRAGRGHLHRLLARARWRASASARTSIAATLRSQNAVIASGTIETPNERIAVRVSGALDSVERARERGDPRRRPAGAPEGLRARHARLRGSAGAAVPLQRRARHRHRRLDGEGRQHPRPRRRRSTKEMTRIESRSAGRHRRASRRQPAGRWSRSPSAHFTRGAVRSHRHRARS